MNDTKRRYLDYEGLSQFWGLVKGYYTTVAGDGHIVDNAKVANKLAETKTFTITDKSGSEGFGTVTAEFDGTQAPVFELDLNKYAKKADVTAVLDLKGVKEQKSELPLTGNKKGDVWIVRKDGEKELNSEFVWVKDEAEGSLSDWEQFGSTIILEGYATEEWVTGQIAIEAAARTAADNDLQSALDTEIADRKTAITEEATARTNADAALQNALDAEAATRKAVDDTKVDKKLTSELGVAEIFNEVDGGGALFTDPEGYKSFVGVNANTKEGIGAQIYDIDPSLKQGTKLDVTRGGIYYTKGEKSGDPSSKRDVADNEIAVIGDVKSAINDIKSIEDYRIRKLFNNREVGSVEDLKARIASGDYDDGVVFTLTASGTVDSRLQIPAGRFVTIELAKDVKIDANDRFITVGVKNGEPSILELVGEGTVEKKASSAQPLVYVDGSDVKGGAGSSLVVDGVTMINNDEANPSLIQSNGSRFGVNVAIRDGKFVGGLYLPADGSVTIDGGDFTFVDNIIYVKGGIFNVNGGYFHMTADTHNGNWAHYNNGSVDVGGAIVIEACNYGGKGNPVVNITGGKFDVAKPATDQYMNYDILVINYDGNVANMAGTTVPYQLADNMSGHVTKDGETEPTDGWYNFTDANTIRVKG